MKSARRAASFVALAMTGLLVCLLAVGCHQAVRPTVGVVMPAATAPVVVTAPPFVLHIPGISGESFVDHTMRRGMIAGFARAGEKISFEIYDWTENDPGIPALRAHARNHVEAHKIAEMIQQRIADEPGRTIYITCHSGGAGLVAWALEELPAGVQVDSVLFIAPALSPTYDLSKVLSHVRRAAYVFWSENDTAILSIGTKTFGTIDGVYGPAAGYTGFVMPPTADKAQYAKLHQIPYDPAWVKYMNDGDHIGPMETAFAQEVLAPTLRGNKP